MAELAVWLTFAATLAGPSAVLWFQRRAFKKQDEAIDSIKRRMDCFETAQHACQLDNAKAFATKEELEKVEERVERCTADIAEIKGRLRP